VAPAYHVKTLLGEAKIKKLNGKIFHAGNFLQKEG